MSQPDTEQGNRAPLYILYTNWKGEKSVRLIIPQRVYYGNSEFHHGMHWLMEAWDMKKQAVRIYKMTDIHHISEEAIQ